VGVGGVDALRRRRGPALGTAGPAAARLRIAAGQRVGAAERARRRPPRRLHRPAPARRAAPPPPSPPSPPGRSCSFSSFIEQESFIITRYRLLNSVKKKIKTIRMSFLYIKDFASHFVVSVKLYFYSLFFMLRLVRYRIRAATTVPAMIGIKHCEIWNEYLKC